VQQKIARKAVGGAAGGVLKLAQQKSNPPKNNPSTSPARRISHDPITKGKKKLTFMIVFVFNMPTTRV
jgi:hypothetical protein